MIVGKLKSQLMNPDANAIVVDKIGRGVRPDFRDIVIRIHEELKTQQPNDPKV